MDYKKEYVNVLMRAEEAVQKGCLDRNTFDAIFSELAESEDERIREEIISALKFANDGGVYDKHIAYLEKQKEQEHPDGCFTCDEYKKGYEAGRLHGFTAGYNKAMKEQKSNIEICPHSTKSKSYKETGYPSVTRFVYKKSDEVFIRDCANILKANDYGASAERLLSMLEQKPAEWSEEDKDMLRRCIESITQHRNDCAEKYPSSRSITDADNPYNEEITWLKSLRPQPKQEWNEEDSKRYISIRTTLEISAVLSKEDYDANVVWLRNLVNAKKYSGHKPSWKPSEEQMSMLLAVIRDPNNAGSESCHLALESLNEDLNKLI